MTLEVNGCTADHWQAVLLTKFVINRSGLVPFGSYDGLIDIVKGNVTACKLQLPFKLEQPIGVLFERKVSASILWEKFQLAGKVQLQQTMLPELPVRRSGYLVRRVQFA